LGSCTANALCGIIGYVEPALFGSRLFLYYNERNIEGDVSSDAGAALSDGIQSLETYGICAETEWSYDVSKFTVKPTEQCYVDALKHQALQVKKIQNDMFNMKNALAQGYPFVVGITIYESFESDAVAQNGMVPMPDVNTEQVLGGHAVCCVGYNDVKKVWIMRNSWGTNWGDSGYFYLPYQYLVDSSLATDLWTIIKMD
jgi:C1A family cysteine protease